jgi:branched-chain amino acid aminotransferase
MSEALVDLNGQLVPASQAHLALHDAGFVMGATITDLCRTVRHQLYRWDDHLARFRNSCQVASLTLPVTDAELTSRAQELVAHNAALIDKDEDLALVLFITPGPIGYYSGLDTGLGDAPPTFGMHTFPLPFARYRRLFRQGAHLAVPSTRHVPAICVDPQIKHRSRLHWWLADREVHSVYPGAMAVLLDAQGYLTETASANLLLVKDGTVFASPEATVLFGISLQVLVELCREIGIAMVRRPLTVADALAADEILLTSTPYCLCGVSRWGEQTIPWPGPVFQRLQAAWSGKIGLDIPGQIEKTA